MPENIKLSPNFTLNEFLVTSHSATIMLPPKEIIDNLKFLATSVMEPLRKIINVPILVNSAYRNEVINKAVNGAKNSLHLKGLACDFHIGMVSTEIDLDFFNKAIKRIDFNKFIYYIHEHRFHVEVKKDISVMCVNEKRAFIKSYLTFEYNKTV